MTAEPPNLKQFRTALAEAKAGKGTPITPRADNFDKWRRNDAKCAPGSELRATADALWLEYETWRAQPAPPRQPPRTSPVPATGRRDDRSPRRDAPTTAARPRGPAPQRGDNAGAADPACLGAPFHNSYTFIPFPPPGWFTGPRERRPPTPLTIDEIEPERFTGVLDLELRTLSPLLTCSPRPVDREAAHKTYTALVSGHDVIVPATGVRGALRTLLTILAGGTLGYLDEAAWLVQGRDLPLGPKGKKSPATVPERCHLARVTQPGTFDHPGRVRLGQTRLYLAEKLESLSQKCGLGKLPRPDPQSDKAPHVHGHERRWCNPTATSMRTQRDDEHPWEIKVSGRPIDSTGKREGLFFEDGPEIELPARLWADYLGRNRHGTHPELRKDDLVWLELADPNQDVTGPNDVISLQWARWGRRGERLLEVVRKRHAHVLPDAFNPDGRVDEVTDLFGHVPQTGVTGAAPAFAARVRPENLVFFDALGQLDRAVPLAPLQPPHPGCAAFYRDCDDLDRIANHDLPLRGYKVYRTTHEQGDAAPWRYASQGVYDNTGRPKPADQKVNKTCDLLRPGVVGRLRLACRGLTRRELALLLAACSVDWRLGGGKPLGLGHCRVERVVVRDETGTEIVRLERSSDERATLPEPYAALVSDLDPRLDLWHLSQRPVERLRYPRAVDENRNGKQRGGHAWFHRHANPRKSGSKDELPKGLEVVWTEGELRQQAGGIDRIRAQALPALAPDPRQDQLYGYDLLAPQTARRVDANNVTWDSHLVPFDVQAHTRPDDRSGGAHAPTRDTRRQERSRREPGER